MTLHAAALLLLTLAGVAPSAEGVPARRIDVQAFTFTTLSPEVVLGDTREVELELLLNDDGEAPLRWAAPTVKVSTGEITPLERIAPSRWRFRYLPPQDRFPHVALFGALLEDPQLPRAGFFALPLHGRGQVEVKTSPKSEVVLQIGDRSFGPVRADERGRALVDVTAPPGPTKAIARSVDPSGVASERSVDLGVPAFPRLLLVWVDDTVVATRAGKAELLFFAVDRQGDAASDAAIAVRADVGTFHPRVPAAVAPGVFLTAYRPGPSSLGNSEVVAALQGDAVSVARASIARVPGEVASARLTPAVARVEVTEGGHIEVQLELHDASGQPLPATAGYVDVTEGRWERVDEARDGPTTLRWFLPTVLSGEPPRIAVRDDRGEVLAEAQVELAPAAAARLVLEPIPPLVADGTAAAQVRARVEDRFGNVVDVVPQLESDEVQLGAPRWSGEHFESTLVPPPRELSGSVVVRARSASLVAETTVQLLPMPVPPLFAAAGMWVLAGYDDPVVTGPVVSFLSPLPLESFFVGLRFGYLASPGAGDATPLATRVAPLLAEAAWRRGLGDVVTLQLGLATGLCLTETARASNRAVTTSLRGEFVVGAGLALGPGELQVMGALGASAPLPATIPASWGGGGHLAYRLSL